MVVNSEKIIFDIKVFLINFSIKVCYNSFASKRGEKGNPMFTKSETALSAETVAKVAERYRISPWTKRGDARYYLNANALLDIIGLRQDFHGSGNVSYCCYTDADGNDVEVANRKAYGKFCKTYICGGHVYSDWQPYGADIAELAARNIAKSF